MKLIILFIFITSLFANIKPFIPYPLQTTPKTKTYSLSEFSHYYFDSYYFGKTTQKQSSLIGIYLSNFFKHYKIEADIEFNVKQYENSISTKQKDYSLFLHSFYSKIDYKSGIHFIQNGDKLTNHAFIIDASLLYFEPYKYNFGIDMFYSNYLNSANTILLMQYTPKFGISIGDYFSKFGSFYLGVNFTNIKPLTNRILNHLKKSYNSTQITIINYKNQFETSISYWKGERNFGVENGGFVVNNVNQLQKSGLTISEKYYFNTIASTTFTIKSTKFTDDIVSIGYLINFNYKF